MDGRGEYQKGTRVYVGGLSQGTKKEDLETEFEKFGKLNNVWVAFNPPGFAFIEFSNKTDAENACDSMNGTELLGGKLRVELSRSRGRGGFRGSTGRSRGSFRGVGGGQGAGGVRFGGRGRRGSQFGGRRGGGSARGGFRMSRDFSRRGRGHGGFVGGGNDYGDGSYGNGKVGCSNRSVYDGSSGATSRYRSRSPIGAGGGGARY